MTTTEGPTRSAADRLRPLDLPFYRHELFGFLGTELAEQMYARLAQETDFLGSRPGMAYGPQIVAAERKRVGLAELYYVSEDMTALASIAGRTLPGYLLQREDLPSDFGIIYFAGDAIGKSWGDQGEEANLCAFAWGVLPPQETFPRGAVWISSYTLGVEVDQTAVVSGRITSEQADMLRTMLPRWRYDNEFLWLFGEEAELTGEDFEGSALDEWGRTIRAAWTLMQQPITTTAPEPVDRHTRKRAEREQVDLAAVRVVRLRHASSADAQRMETDREYRHRWIVKGHWRQQWYPTRKVHRPVWISPHIKGPEDAPILGTEKVYTWTR